MRYQFYREHKYVSASLNDLERLIAKTNFCDSKEVSAVEKAFRSLMEMLQGHATYENSRLHALLKARHSKIHAHAEEDHRLQDEQLHIIQGMIHSISQASSDGEKISLGYTLYLTYRKFVAENLLHLHEEETQILPELQRLYTDAELREVEASSYREMSAEEIRDMVKILFHHMNVHDQKAVLEDIQILAPSKFADVVKGLD